MTETKPKAKPKAKPKPKPKPKAPPKPKDTGRIATSPFKEVRATLGPFTATPGAQERVTVHAEVVFSSAANAALVQMIDYYVDVREPERPGVKRPALPDSMRFEIRGWQVKRTKKNKQGEVTKTIIVKLEGDLVKSVLDGLCQINDQFPAELVMVQTDAELPLDDPAE